MQSINNKQIKKEIISLSNKDIKPCHHCDYCKNNNSICYIEDDMLPLYDNLKEADVFLFASPVYAMNITPHLQAFFSRIRPLHEVKGGALRNNLAAGIAVGGTRNGGQENTINSIAMACLTRGIIFIGNEPGFYSGGMIWSKDNGSSGVESDDEGMDSLKALGARIEEVALDYYN